MNEGCMVVKCERCGSETHIMMRSVRSELFLCPVCLESEIECQLIKPTVLKMSRNPGDSPEHYYPYVSDLTGIAVN